MWYAKWSEWLKHRTLNRKTGKKTHTHCRVRSAYFFDEKKYEMALDFL